MRLTKQRTLVELLCARRHIQSGVLVKEVDRLHRHLDDLTRHDGEVLDTGDVVDAELDVYDQVLVDDVVFAVSPAAHTGTAARLVCVFAAGVEFAVAVLDGVDVAVGEFDTLVVEGVLVGDTFLEWRSVDFVGDGLVVDGVADVDVLNFEGAVGVGVEVVAAGLRDEGFFGVVACAVGVEVAAGHRESIVVYEAVGVAVDGGVDAEGEDVLVVGCQDSWVDDSAPRDADAVVDRLS